MKIVEYDVYGKVRHSVYVEIGRKTYNFLLASTWDVRSGDEAFRHIYDEFWEMYCDLDKEVTT